MDYGVTLSSAHVAALDWFAAHAGQVVPWSSLNKGEQRLAIIPKGIYRPKDWRHSLSIKIIPGGGYPDEEPHSGHGGRRFRYHEETPKGLDPASFPTNVGLANCMDDGVPVGVIRRLNPKPKASYEVLGLGHVTAWANGFFDIELLEAEAPGVQRARVAESKSSAVPEVAPVSLADAREKITSAIVRRRGQGKFRAALMKAYLGRCAISGCAVPDVLEAAHIKPYLGDHTNVVQNGLLLRADLHTLFDLKLLTIDPSTRAVVMASALQGTEYWAYHGRALSLPLSAKDWPAQDCLEYAWTAQAVVAAI
ncbi:HNH endonuclease [Caulobacter endophyticus]|uniref:HNH endonuclease n=1 Tax=Caulobacter endophyticus TaxID=2172652 RepID=UPI00240FE6D6|nr:HNH endonuclease [Caulobacter endophyticus]MDG2531278.1 HNH endonuclease [Caulobacter endophyticus]